MSTALQTQQAKAKVRDEIRALLPEALEIAKRRQAGPRKSLRVERIEQLMQPTSLDLAPLPSLELVRDDLARLIAEAA